MACGTGDWDRHPGSGRAADLFGHAAYLCKASAGAVLLSGPCCSLVAHACARRALLMSGACSAWRGPSHSHLLSQAAPLPLQPACLMLRPAPPLQELRPACPLSHNGGSVV